MTFNDLHKVIQHFNVHHLADDAKLFLTSKSVRNLNKLANSDFKQLNNWLNAKKISFNVEKTEIVIFKSPIKVLSDEIKINLTGQRLYPSSRLWHMKQKGVCYNSIYLTMKFKRLQKCEKSHTTQPVNVWWCAMIIHSFLYFKMRCTNYN